MMTFLPTDLVTPTSPDLLDEFGRMAEVRLLQNLIVTAKDENYELWNAKAEHLRALYPMISFELYLEMDFNDEDSLHPWEDAVGRVHSLYCDGKRFDISRKEFFSGLINAHFSKEPDRLMKLYFQTVANIPKKIACNFVRDLDLPRRWNLFDESDPRFRRAMLDALDALLDRNFHILLSTDRSKYLSPLILRRIAERRGSLVLTSDAGTPKDLLRGVSDALLYARAAGIGGVDVLTKNGWEKIPIKV